MRWSETILQDIRYTLRAARKSPGFVMAATGTLALGIGAITAIFSIVSGVLLRPLPFSHPEGLVQLSQQDARNGTTNGVFYGDLEDWRKQNTAFEAMVAYGYTSRSLLDVADPERIQAVWAELGLFRMLGVQPLMGRAFREDDPLDVVVLSAGRWKRRFGADPACIGRKITLDREPYTVIGVMPESFQFPYRSALTEVWIPWKMPAQRAANRSSRVDNVVARVKRGISFEAASRQLTVMASRLATQFPDTNKGRTAFITPLSEV